MTRNARHAVFLFIIVVCLLLAACDGGGIDNGLGDSCGHLDCLPETDAMPRLEGLLEDAEDGVIDEGESELGDALLSAAQWLVETGP
ncbi:MAG: hypothetical protein KBE23_23905 [Chloroflexi bacterium]|nr:hypothetical protein [Chloroflexota bacterium]